MRLFLEAAGLLSALRVSAPALAQGRLQVRWFGQSPPQYKKLEARGKVDLIFMVHDSGARFA
jgi:hypothetical protein